MNQTQEANASTTRFRTVLLPEGGWAVADNRYQIRENPDPWVLPGEEPRGNYVVEAMMHGHFYYYLTERASLEECLHYIQEDMASPVWRTNQYGMAECRWCREEHWAVVRTRGCNLCEKETRA